MQDELERERRTLEQVAQQPLGLTAGLPSFPFPRIYAGQVAHPGQAAEITALPADPENVAQLQDPATGEFYFMADWSAVDGPDPVQ